jgi:hypothetical protein
MRKDDLTRAIVGSLGILLAGFATIPLAAWVSGAHVDLVQGAKMSIIFFLGRIVWLYYVPPLVTWAKNKWSKKCLKH